MMYTGLLTHQTLIIQLTVLSIQFVEIIVISYAYRVTSKGTVMHVYVTLINECIDSKNKDSI